MAARIRPGHPAAASSDINLADSAVGVRMAALEAAMPLYFLSTGHVRILGSRSRLPLRFRYWPRIARAGYNMSIGGGMD